MGVEIRVTVWSPQLHMINNIGNYFFNNFSYLILKNKKIYVKIL